MKRGRKAGVPNGDAAMPFSAIGAALGISERQVHGVYRYAMQKLRTNTPNALAYMGMLADELEAERRSRSGY